MGQGRIPAQSVKQFAIYQKLLRKRSRANVRIHDLCNMHLYILVLQHIPSHATIGRSIPDYGLANNLNTLHLACMYVRETTSSPDVMSLIKINNYEFIFGVPTAI